MRVTVKNLTRGAIDLPGKVLLPALGEWTGEIEDSFVAILEVVPSVAITRETETETETGTDPLDSVRAEYKRLSGKRADKRWSAERLFEEIESLDTN